MTNRDKLNAELELRIKELENIIKIKKLELDDYSEELDLLNDLLKLRKKNEENDLKDDDLMSDERFLSIEHFKKLSYVQDEDHKASYSEQYGIAGEKALRDFPTIPMDKFDIWNQILKMDYMSSSSDNAESNVVQRLMSRWVRYYEDGIKQPYMFLKDTRPWQVVWIASKDHIIKTR